MLARCAWTGGCSSRSVQRASEMTSAWFPPAVRLGSLVPKRLNQGGSVPQVSLRMVFRGPVSKVCSTLEIRQTQVMPDHLSLGDPL